MTPSDSVLSFFSPLFNRLDKGVTVTTGDPLDPRIVYVNPAFERLTGYALSDCLGENPRFLQGSLTDRRVIESIKDSLTNWKPFLARAVNYRKDGQPFLMEWVIYPLRSMLGDVNHYVAFQQEAQPHETSSLPQDLSRHSRDLAQLLLTAQELERERIARDLHDSMGQLLAAARMQVASSALATDKPEVLDLLDRAIVENRNITFNLMPEALRSRGLSDALQELARRFQTSTVTLKHQVQGTPHPMSEWQAFQIFRIAQEAIRNAIRHSDSDAVLIVESYEPEQYELVVRDFGKGMAGEAKNGMGLKNLRYRAELIGGELDVRSQQGKGTTVRLVVPLPTHDAPPHLHLRSRAS